DRCGRKKAKRLTTMQPTRFIDGAIEFQVALIRMGVKNPFLKSSRTFGMAEPRILLGILAGIPTRSEPHRQKTGQSVWMRCCLERPKKSFCYTVIDAFARFACLAVVPV